MARKPFTFENNFEKVRDKVREKPYKVMNILGQTLTKEIRANIKGSNSSRRGMLAHSLGYWARKKERDLQIGFKMSIVANAQEVGPGIVGDMITRKEQDPIFPVVLKNVDLIVQTIAEALDEIRRE
jgi:hypothetical protein